jgi:autotransporter-associated beta strand protein
MATYVWNTTSGSWSTLSNWRVGGSIPASLPTTADDVQILTNITATQTVTAATSTNAQLISIGDTSPYSNQWSLSAASQSQGNSLVWTFPSTGGTINVPTAGAAPYGFDRSTVWISIGGNSTGSLTKTGLGTVSFIGGTANNFSGDFNISEGVVQFTAGTSTTLTMGSGTTRLANGTYLGGFGNTALSYASNIAVNGSSASAFLFYNSNGTPTSATFSGTISIPASSTLTGRNTTTGTIIISGVISGAGTLTHSIAAATGTLRLDAANTFTGLVQNVSGTLALNSVFAVQDATLDTDNLGGTVTFLNNSYIGGLTGSTAFTLPGGATTTIGGVNAAVTALYNGALSGTTQLYKQQAGVQTLGGTSTRTTATTFIAAGAIQLTNANGLYSASGSGATTVNGGGLWLSSGITTPSTAPLTLYTTSTGTSSALRSVSGSNIYAGTIDVTNTFVGDIVSIYADLTSTLTLSSTVTLSTIVNFSGTGTHVVTGTLTATGAVQKSDAGILKLQNASTKSAGAWTLNGGETWLANANALGGSGSSIAVSTVAAGAALYVVGAITIPSNKTISALAGTLGAISTGGGTWSGAITLSASTATIANSTGSTFTVSATVNPSASNYTLTYSGNGVIAQTGAITGSRASAVTVNMSGGTVTFSGANNYTGTTTLSAGTANAGIANTAGTSGPFGASTAASSILMTGGTLQYSSVNTFDYSGRLGTAGSQTWNIDTNGQSVTFASALQGTGSSLTKLGTGTLTLSGANTYTGAVTVSAGTLTASTATSLGAASSTTDVSVANGATLILSSVGNTVYSSRTLKLSGGSAINLTVSTGNRYTFAAITANTANTIFTGNGFLIGPVATGTTTPTFSPELSGDQLSIESAITGTGGMTVGRLGDAGTVVLPAANSSLSGTVALAYATLIIGDNASLGTGTLTIANGTAIDVVSVALNVVNPITVNGSFTYRGFDNLTQATGAISIAAPATVTVSANTLSLGGAVAFSNALTKAGAGTLALPSANTGGGGVTLSAGTLSIGNASALGTGTLVFNGGTLDASTSLTVTNALTVSANITFTGTAALTLSAAVALGDARTVTVNGSTLTLSGVVSGGALKLTKAGAGILKLTNANTYSGGTDIGGTGTVQAGNTQALSNNGTVRLTASGATLQTLTAGSQNGKLTITGYLDNSAGGTIKIGG